MLINLTILAVVVLLYDSSASLVVLSVVEDMKPPDDSIKVCVCVCVKPIGIVKEKSYEWKPSL